LFQYVAKVPAEYRRSILLTALDRSADLVADKARRALTRRWPDADVAVVDTPPVAGILREAQRVRADVIVVGWRGYGAVRGFLMGSVSRRPSVPGLRCAYSCAPSTLRTPICSSWVRVAPAAYGSCSWGASPRAR
jgi:Universal stress protein family